MKRKEIFRLMFPAAAFAGMVLLASCSADELNSGGGSTIVPPSGETVSSGTVNFTNNTSMTIGNGSITEGTTRTAWMTRGKSFDFDGNEACTLSMEGQPDYEAQPGTIIDENADKEIEDVSGKNITVNAGIECSINSDETHGRVINTDIYVFGTFNLNTFVNDISKGTGRIIVYEGGVLNINDLKGKELSNITILNYGGTVNVNVDNLTIGTTAAFKSKGSLNMADKDLTVYGKLYVGGDLKCKSITSKPTTDDVALIHVLGALTTDEAVEFDGNVDVCVEGQMNVYKMIASNNANIHVDCKLVTNDYSTEDVGVNVTDGATLCASYVNTRRMSVSGGQTGRWTYIYLPEAGVIDVDYLNLGSNALVQPYNSGNALVDANRISIENRVSWKEVLDGSLYVNYETLEADADPTDMTRINKVSINEGNYDCSPGFTTDEPEDPDTPTGDGDIELEIDLGIDEEYTLKADDFAIRVNGKYDEIKVDGNNTATALNNIKITEDDLRVIVSGITEAIQDDQDYTFEVWIWVDNAKEVLREDGSGLTEWRELFDENKKLEWVGGQPGADKDPYGEDISKDYVTVISSPAGYHVRYNVYRGISGNPDASHENVEMLYPLGDTPYVKVSVHVQKRDSSPANDAVPVYEPLDEIPEP